MPFKKSDGPSAEQTTAGIAAFKAAFKAAVAAGETEAKAIHAGVKALVASLDEEADGQPTADGTTADE